MGVIGTLAFNLLVKMVLTLGGVAEKGVDAVCVLQLRDRGCGGDLLLLPRVQGDGAQQYAPLLTVLSHSGVILGYMLLARALGTTKLNGVSGRPKR